MKTLTFLFIIVFSGVSFSQTPANAPSQNKKIIAYVKTKIGKTTGDVDLIELAYNAAKLKYDSRSLGKTVYPFETKIYPGDIVSFSYCEVKWENEDKTWSMGYSCAHEYIIYKVYDMDTYQVAIQETNENGETVVNLYDFSWSQIKRKRGGGASFYRPQNIKAAVKS